MSAYAPHPPSPLTSALNARVREELPFDDTRDLAEAERGFLGTIDLSALRNQLGGEVWNSRKYDFLDDGDIEDSVNPSLLRLARLNNITGLFEVVPGVYQVRGFDLSNMTIIEGDEGVIIIDPLVSVETAGAALDLYRSHRGNRRVTAVIYTHSHVDHYSGVRGVTSEEAVANGTVRVIAPAAFLEEAVAENVFAGNAMQRRSLFQYGPFLPGGARGSVDAGLGKQVSNGTMSLIAPTEYVHETGETLVIDGVEFEFVMAPHTEAPSEFMLWCPKWNLLNSAEDVTHTIHNLLTLRGAQVRDAVSWWKALHELLGRYGDRVEVLIAQHHWPAWGNERVREIISDQRDLYKYLHDEVLRLANHGYTIMEIPEMIELPDSIGKKWHNRGYYGSVHHNAKAVYQRYLGWWDGNPSTFYAHPPTEAAKRFVKLGGGADAVLEKGRASFEEGDYRWVAEVANKLVFADPENRAARELGARALEQLAYQSENPTWRNAFLMGALELVEGPSYVAMGSLANVDVISAMTPELLLDFLGILLNGPAASGESARIRWTIPATGQRFLIELRNGIVIYTEGSGDPVDVELSAQEVMFAGLINGAVTLEEASQHGRIEVTGDRSRIELLLSLLDRFPQMFPIVEP